ncbi:uncharacterized protein [Vulpes vulpes]|uniref:Uncharacterized protein isoform X1 n=1 Tax=Vulpes vulpes TaxID=9627 RepID=A0ABM5B250_VULVU
MPDPPDPQHLVYFHSGLDLLHGPRMCGGLSALGLELQPQQDPGGPDARWPERTAARCTLRVCAHSLLCGLVGTLLLAIFRRVSSLPKMILLLVLTASYILVLELSSYTRASGSDQSHGVFDECRTSLAYEG